MLTKILTTKKFWQLAALVALAAIPVIMFANRQSDPGRFTAEPGDDSDMFEQE